MALYIDRNELPADLNSIPSGVLQFVIDEHRRERMRFDRLHNAYMGKNFPQMTEADDISVCVDYPRYIVDTLCGMYLGDPVRYNTAENDSITRNTKATVKDGAVVRVDKIQPIVDIEPIIEVYKKQSISDADTEIGRDIGEYGTAYELVYASDDPDPIPKSTVCDPRSSVMVRDTTVDHHKLFFMTYEQRKHIDNSLYYAVFVYTANECISYYSDGIESPLSFDEIDRIPHYFGEVPAVEYRNNADALGDYETTLSLMDAYNKLMSDRLTDKSRFIDAVLFLYGMSLTEDQRADLKKYGLVDMLPPKSEGAAAEYVQKALDEASVHILADDMVKEIHKQTMTVDMTDASFGTSSGEAMKMKLLTMTMVVKNKIRSMERGLKKRFELYNRWLNVKGVMPIVNKEDVDIVFNISMPVNETQIVDIVTKLQNIVDDETLLSLLWFVKDPQATVEKVKQQKADAQAEYFDTFGFQQKENTINAEDTTAGRTGSEESLSGDIEENTDGGRDTQDKKADIKNNKKTSH